MRTTKTLALAAFTMALCSVTAAQTARVALNLKPQPMRAALKELGAQAGVQILFRVEDVARDGKSAPAVSGQLSVQEALERLLADTGLTYEFVNERTVRVAKAEDGEALQKASEGRAESERPLEPARAQGESPQADASRESVTSSLEEIIVTANKRQERLQDVPLSIAVVTAEDIDRRGLVGAADYLRGMPGVNQVESPFGQSIIIRGLETSPAFQNFSAGTTVATYFGETQTTNSSGLAGGTNIDVKLVDIERVEVLRGPQGTAFGGSALGGVVRTIPAAPNPARFEGKVATGYSATSGTGDDNYNVQAAGNIPLIRDVLAVRAAAYVFEDSGYYRNRAGSDAAFRASAVTPYGAEAFAIDQDEVGSNDVRGGRIAALFQPTDALQATLTYLAQKNEMDGYPLQNSGAYEQTMLQVAPAHVVRGQRNGVSDTDLDIVNATVEYDLGWGSVLATFSHLSADTIYAQPFTFYGNNPFVAYPASALGMSEHRERTGELRLSTALAGRWNFLVGLYGEDIDDDYLDDSLWHGSDTSNIFGVADIGGHTDVRNQKQRAAFGEVSWELLPRLTLTGGARAYDYDRTSDTAGTGLYGDGSITHRDSDASGTSFRGNLKYSFDDSTLVYAGWSQGFRLGKPQPGLPPGLCDTDGNGIVDGTSGLTINQTRSIASDEVDSYEIGARSTLLDRRLVISASVYRIDWTDIPVRALAPRLPGCGLAYSANAGEARSEGVELQANAYVTDALRIDVGASHTSAELTRDAPGLLPPAFDGDRLPGSPEFNASLGLQYDFQIGHSSAFVRADSIYVGSFYGDLQETLGTKAGGYVKVDASARVTFDKLSIELFVRNLTNRDDFTFRDTSPLVPAYGYRLRPRTTGLQLSVAF